LQRAGPKKLKGAHLPDNSGKKRFTRNFNKINSRENTPLLTLERSIKEKMKKHVMILRSENSLLSCLNYLTGAGQYLEDLKLREDLSPVIYTKLRNLITTGKLVAESALARRESKGAHFRKDFPNL